MLGQAIELAVVIWSDAVAVLMIALLLGGLLSLPVISRFGRSHGA